MSASPPTRLLGTFHKTGSVLWNRILFAAEAQGAIKRWHVNRTEAPETWDVAFDFHSKDILEMIKADPENTRAVFCIRDPRDIVVSGAYYHMTSTEGWLHRPREDMGGLTYQQKICSLPDMQARFQFEMDFAANNSITRIMTIPTSSPNVAVTKLETLVQDVDLQEFSRLFDFLAFDDRQREILLGAARDKSLFAKNAKQSAHVRNGKPAQYLTEFSDETLAMFNAKFPGAPEAFGYPR